MLRLGKITVTPGLWFMLGGTLLLGALEVMPLIALAALLHELGHLSALSMFGVHVEEIYFTGFGAEIRADLRYLPYWKDILCTLAGPVANIAAAFVFARTSGDYLLAGANLLQGCFNLLPLTGLDGARALQLSLCLLLDPVRAERISRAVEIIFAAALTVTALYAVVLHHTGGFLLLSLVGIFVSIWRERTAK